MLYLFISILSLSFLDVTRKFVVRGCSPWLMTCAMCGFLAIGLFIFGGLFSSLTIPDSEAVTLGILSGIVGIGGNVFLMQALKFIPLSVAVPLLSFSSVWVVIVEILFLELYPTSFHLIGILFVLIGSLVLIYKEKIKNKHPKYFLFPICSSICWGIQTFIDPIGIQQIGIWSWGILICSVGALGTAPFCIKEISHITRYWKGLSMLSFWSGVGVMLQLTALQSIQPSVVETVKRGLILPLSLFFGKTIFKEDLTFEKIFAILFLVIGTYFAAS